MFTAAKVWLLIGVGWVRGVSGFSHYRASFPNGRNVVRNGQAWRGVGHTQVFGGGPRNSFGMDFAAAGHQWTEALCRKDSDGDGQSNGLELGDPDCVWTRGDTPARTDDISHPGYADSLTQVMPTTTPAKTTPTITPTVTKMTATASNTNASASNTNASASNNNVSASNTNATKQVDCGGPYQQCAGEGATTSCCQKGCTCGSNGTVGSYRQCRPPAGASDCGSGNTTIEGKVAFLNHPIYKTNAHGILTHPMTKGGVLLLISLPIMLALFMVTRRAGLWVRPAIGRNTWLLGPYHQVSTLEHRCKHDGVGISANSG